MWLSLLFLVLILAVVYVQSTFGLFSALIMTVLTVCCASIAVGTHEWVAVHWLAPHWRPDYAYAIALAATFGVPLIILRVATDKLIRRSCLLPLWVNRIGGAFCGLIIAFTLVGVMALAVENIPFGGSILGFARVDLPSREVSDDGSNPKPPDLSAKDQELLLKPDRFVVGLTSVLSAGAFSGDRLFALDHPDLVTALGWVGAAPSEVSRFVYPDSISIVRTEVVPYVYDLTAKDREAPIYDKVDPPSGHEYRMIRVALRDRARDERKSHAFTIRQFRLVGTEPDSGRYRMFFPIAIQQADAAQPVNRYIQRKWTRWGQWPVVNDLFSPRDDNQNQVEIVFDLPLDFSPSYLAYKHGARVAVSFEAEEPEQSGKANRQKAPPSSSTRTASHPPDGPRSQPPAAGASKQTRGRSRRRSANAEGGPKQGRKGRVRGVTTRTGDSAFTGALPIAMNDYRSLKNLNVTGKKLVGGHIIGKVNEQKAGSSRPLSRFDVPRDKRLLQLSTDRLHTRSGLGRAIDFAASTVQNYYVEDANGNRYRMIGKYAIANVNGTRTIEIQYFPDQAGSIGGLGAFKKIKDRHLRRNYQLVLLFLVEPGAEITSFSTGGSATRRDDLRSENLVAPE